MNKISTNPIIKIKSPKFNELYYNYVSKKQPVIIQGDMDNWLGFGKWDLEFFKSVYGNDEVEVTNFPRNDAPENEFNTTPGILADYIKSFDICNWNVSPLKVMVA